MDVKLLTLYEHKDLLESLGYVIKCPLTDLVTREEEGYQKSEILYNDKIVGDIGLEERNLFYLFRDNRFVGNNDLSLLNFSKRKKKNMRTLVHTRLYHNDLQFNCFNMLYHFDTVNGVNRDFICLSDLDNIMITKHLDDDFLEIISLNENIPSDDILDELRKKRFNKSLTYRFKGVNEDEYKN